MYLYFGPKVDLKFTYFTNLFGVRSTSVTDPITDHADNVYLADNRHFNGFPLPIFDVGYTLDSRYAVI